MNSALMTNSTKIPKRTSIVAGDGAIIRGCTVRLPRRGPVWRWLERLGFVKPDCGIFVPPGARAVLECVTITRD